MNTAILLAIKDEAFRAQERYGYFASTHEALGVLAEEWDELRDAIRANDLAAIEREAIQVAAVAARLAEHCRARQLPFVERSGG